MVRIWPGVADGWFLPHTGLVDHAGQMLMTANQFIFVSCIENKIRRLQTAIDFNRAKALRFAMALGMKPEATLKCYGTHGQDYLLLARIFRS